MLVVQLTAEQLASIVRDAVRSELSQRDRVDEWLDTAGAAAVLKLHPEHVSRMARRGELPASKVGSEWRFRRSELDAHLARR